MRCVVLSGGIGGAKLALGLDRLLAPGALTIIANTGDDFEHLGLAISPDLDTLLYTLADLVNPDTGWGRRDETWSFMEELTRLGGETWFRLGDRDLAVHIERTRRLAAGESLSSITADLARRLGIRSQLLPMSDAPVRTRVRTAGDTLGFQEYFVRDQARPISTGFEYAGADSARPPAAALEALVDPALVAILIAPSNPWLSIGPMLAIPALRQALLASPAPVVAVSPIVAGAAVKGPTAKIMRELGLPASAEAVALHYRELLDGFILDASDRGAAAAIEPMGMAAAATNTVMRTLDEKTALARFALEFAGTIRSFES
jgi:LPPG:FO 2-phospho-L-lactate transferase